MENFPGVNFLKGGIFLGGSSPGLRSFLGVKISGGNFFWFRVEFFERESVRADFSASLSIIKIQSAKAEIKRCEIS